MSITSAPIRILVDLTWLRPGGEGGGIKPALHEIIHWLGRQPGEAIVFVFLANRLLAGEIDRWLRPVDRLIWGDGAPDDLAAQEDCQLVYCPFGITRWACPGIPTIALIVDLLHKDFPESLSVADCNYRADYFRITAERADLFQVISDHTATQLGRHYNIPVDRIIRTHLPVHGRLPPRSQTSPTPGAPPYFFYPANAWVHKNHATLLVAYALYRHAAGPDAWRLVLTGHRNAAMQHLERIAASLDITECVDFLGYVNESRLAGLWSRAGALVFPSLHEGFGIPLLEAMAHAVPILASDSGAIPEITAGAALLVAARAPQELAQGMQLLATNPELRRTLVEHGQQRLAAFSPAREFGRLLQSFHAIANAPARWQHSGYYPVDGLTDPLAIFALPLVPGPQVLHYTSRPLGISRTVEFLCGASCLAKVRVAADIPTSGCLQLPKGARVLRLIVPDASRLSPTDPRTHGVILGRLQVHHPGGLVSDLLPRSVS